MHIHIPAGSVPKEGSSAGVTLAVALVSLFSGKPVRCGAAMSGEATLSGRLIPVGGVREKVLAAIRAGADTVVLPEGNRVDVEAMAQDELEGVKVVFVGTVFEALPVVLG